MNAYRIKPLEKKSIVYHIEMYRSNDDGSTSWFNIQDTYRWGQGFVDEDMDVNLPYKGDNIAYCKTYCSAPLGSDLDDSCACFFEFSDDISEDEQEEIREAYSEGGAGWVFDGDHHWEVEDDYLEIIGPFQIDLFDENGNIIKENVELKERPVASTDPKSWPF